MSHNIPMRLSILLCFLSVFVIVSANASTCPQIKEVPIPSQADHDYQDTWKGVATPYSVNDWMGGYDFAPLGVGHLRVLDPDQHYYDWAKKIVLPLWDDIDGIFYGWLHSGLVQPVADILAEPLTGAGMVETEYKHLNLTVQEETSDGWIRLQLLPGKDGSKWTHQCYLQLGTAKLEFQLWESFITQKGSWLHFRTHSEHLLRSEPGPNAHLITKIALDHELSLLAIKDEWMRVEVKQPGWACKGSDEEFKGRKDTGWIRWKDAVIGPLVWIYPGGC